MTKAIMSTAVCVHFRRKSSGDSSAKKDQRDLCSFYAAGNILQEKYEGHIIKKEEARTAKSKAKNICNDTTVVLTMDVQSVLFALKLFASAVYYDYYKQNKHNYRYII